MARKTNVVAAKAAASMLVGSEPTGSKLDSASDNYKSEIQVLFNWYSANKTKDDAFKYYIDYIKKNRNKDLKTFQKLSSNDILTTYGWVARLITRGASVSEDHVIRLNGNIDELLKRVLEEEDVPPNFEKQKKTNVVNIQEAIKIKAKEYIGELEGAIDDFILEDKEFSLINDFKGKQIPSPYVAEVKTWAEKKLEEFQNVLEPIDSQITEGYSNFNKRKLRAMVKLFEQFVEDCNLYGQFKKANRKTRAVREKPPAVQVKSLKYKTKDDELNIESEKAADIIGSQQVWLFNTKTRKLAVYTSDSTKGMSVKGTTLQNWTPEKSMQKTLRKPEEQIKDLMSSGKVKLRTFMDSIKSKQGDVNGRINIDTVILKILR